MIGMAVFVPPISYFQTIVATNVGKAVTGNLQSLVLANGGFLIAANICLFITGYVQALVVTDVFFTVVANGISLVVVYLQLVIFLGPQINELFVFFVLEAEFVVTTTLMGLGAEDRFGPVSRQAIRRHIGGMIGSPGDNRLIRITIQKTHDDLVPHPRQCDHRSEEHTSELQSRPHLVCRRLLEKKKS